MTNKEKALVNISEEVSSILRADVAFTEVSNKNGYTTYESQDLSKLTGILGGVLIKKAFLSACVNDSPVKDGTYWWSVDWRFEVGAGSNGNGFIRVWTNEDGDIVAKR
jgi:hypothetical protein